MQAGMQPGTEKGVERMEKQKREYRPPILEECGSVRSLTRTDDIIGSEPTDDVGLLDLGSDTEDS